MQKGRRKRVYLRKITNVGHYFYKIIIGGHNSLSISKSDPNPSNFLYFNIGSMLAPKLKEKWIEQHVEVVPYQLWKELVVSLQVRGKVYFLS